MQTASTTRLTLAFKAPLFKLGRLVATPGALDALAPWPGRLEALVHRHVAGDWGVVSDDDRHQNDWAALHDDRILSAYPIDESKPSRGYGENTVWIITEWDRSVTTVLLPEDY